jgi:hypothetical protein
VHGQPHRKHRPNRALSTIDGFNWYFITVHKASVAKSPIVRLWFHGIKPPAHERETHIDDEARYASHRDDGRPTSRLAQCPFYRAHRHCYLIGICSTGEYLRIRNTCGLCRAPGSRRKEAHGEASGLRLPPDTESCKGAVSQVGDSPTRQRSLQPVAIVATKEVTRASKPNASKGPSRYIRIGEIGDGWQRKA